MSIVVTVRILGLSDDLQPEPFVLDRGAEWPTLCAMIQSVMDSVGAPISADDLDIRYWDGEDHVMVSSQSELDEALSIAEASGILPLYVRHCDSSVFFSLPYEPAQPTTSNTTTATQQENTVKKEFVEQSYAAVNTETAELKHGCPRPPKRRADDTFVVYESTLSGANGSLPSAAPCPAPRVQPSVDEMLSVEEAMQDHRAAADIFRDLNKREKLVCEKRKLEEESEVSSAGHSIMPGAASGANVIAIEIPEWSGETSQNKQASHRHCTEAAEPAEMAETGEVSSKSGRDAETGYWMVMKKATDNKCEASSSSSMDVPPAIPPRHPLPSGANCDSPKNVRTQTSKCKHPVEVLKKDKVDEFLRDHLKEMAEDLKQGLAKDVGKYTVHKMVKELNKMRLEHSEHHLAKSPQAKQSLWPLTFHDNFFCDHCNKAISGPRYKCGNCDDYDLCEKCEDIYPPVHDNTHVFVKLRYPTPKAGIKKGTFIHLLKSNIYCSKQDKAQAKASKREREVEHLQVLQKMLMEKEAKVKNKLERNYARLEKRLAEQTPSEGSVKAWDGSKDEGASCVDTGLPEPFLATAFMTLSAEFVSDVTIPDGAVVAPGTMLVKTWTMRNNGTTPWPADTMLQEVYSTLPAMERKVKVGSLLPNTTINITVQLIAPRENGDYESRWRLCYGEMVFGHGVFCKVCVSDQFTDQNLEQPVFPFMDVYQKIKSEEESKQKGEGDGQWSCMTETSSQTPSKDYRCLFKKKFRWSQTEEEEEEEKPELPDRPKCPASEQDEEEKEDGLEEEEEAAREDGREEEMAGGSLTKSSPAVPSTPNNTPFGCSRAVTPPPEDELASDTEAIFRQELEHSLNKSASVSAQQIDEGETEQSEEEEDVEEREEQKSVPLIRLLPSAPASAVQEDGDVEDNPQEEEEEVPLSPSSTSSSVIVMTKADLDVEETGETGERQCSETGAMFGHDHTYSLPRLTLADPEVCEEADGYEILPGNNLSSLSSVSSDSEDDFCIVVPDCFDLNKPLGLQNTTTNKRAHQAAAAEHFENVAPEYENHTAATATEAGPSAFRLEERGQFEFPGPIFVETRTSPESDHDDKCGCHDRLLLQKPVATTAQVVRPDNVVLSHTPTTLASNIQEYPYPIYEFPACPSKLSSSTDSSMEQEATPIPQLKTPEAAAEPEEEEATQEEEEEVEGAAAPKEGGTTRHAAEVEEEAEGAAAAAPTTTTNTAKPRATDPSFRHVVDPEQQLTEFIRAGVTTATSGFQYLYNASKDVVRSAFNTSESYPPRESTFVPPKNSWMPAKKEYFPPRNDYKPPQQNFTMPQSKYSLKPSSETVTPVKVTTSGLCPEYEGEMLRIVEMGYFNKAHIAELLRQHKGDIASVVDALLQEGDNDWAASRH